MSKLTMLGNKVATTNTTRVSTSTTKTQRTTGRPWQRRRLEAWESNPTCAMCSRVVAYPHGFELDHIIPLWAGGGDNDDNCQVLCVWVDEQGDKQGCHVDKTAKEAAERGG